MKIKSIKIYDKVQKDGTKSAGVTFEDEVFGFYNFKGEIDIKEGDDVVYSYEIKKKKDGSGEYKILTLSKPTPATSAPTPQPIVGTPAKVVLPGTERFMESKSFTEMRFEARMNVLKLAVSVYLAGKIEFPQVKEHFIEWSQMADAAIDELKE